MGIHEHRLIGLPELLRLTNSSRTVIRELEAAGNFPKRVRMSDKSRRVAWWLNEVMDFLEGRPRGAAIAPKEAIEAAKAARGTYKRRIEQQKERPTR